MTKNHISREYFFSFGIPLGYTKSGQRPTQKPRETDQPSRFYSKAFRRGHVQLFCSTLIAFLVTGLTSANLLVISLLGLSMLIPVVLIRISIYSIVDLPLSQLDEREIIVRENSFEIAYKMLFVFLILLVLAVLLLGQAIELQHFMVVGTALLLTIYTLPSAVIAWQTED